MAEIRQKSTSQNNNMCTLKLLQANSARMEAETERFESALSREAIE